MHNALGIERGFVVHANTYGFDNSVDLVRQHVNNET